MRLGKLRIQDVKRTNHFPVYYDRVLVMDHGLVAEMDTPLNLFDKFDSIFRSLCDEAGLSRQDTERIRGVVASL